MLLSVAAFDQYSECFGAIILTTIAMMIVGFGRNLSSTSFSFEGLSVSVLDVPGSVLGCRGFGQLVPHRFLQKEMGVSGVAQRRRGGYGRLCEATS